MRREQYIDFKDGVNNLDLLFIHPSLMMMLAYVNNFAYRRGIPFRLTSLIRTEEEEIRLGAVSRTHRDGRAFDFSTKGWSEDDKVELEMLLYFEFEDIAAISSRTKEPTPIVFHNSGHGPHGHVQCRR